MNSTLICPRCNAVLECTTIDDVVKEYAVFQCPSCEGYWFSRSSELNELSKVSDLSILEFTHMPSLEEQMEPLLCPSCEDKPLMDKVEHKKDRRAIMDVCPKCHGVWLDSGELEAIQTESWGSLLGKLYKWLVKGN
ncbi:MAG TPA: zf-TFIIB domain-containing protein [Bacteroidales bacterium]|nr:zf-TFIIB domain-containing protein [Bacteroidales bacterium]